jgi:hypothetical protein
MTLENPNSGTAGAVVIGIAGRGKRKRIRGGRRIPVRRQVGG